MICQTVTACYGAKTEVCQPCYWEFSGTKISPSHSHVMTPVPVRSSKSIPFSCNSHGNSCSRAYQKNPENGQRRGMTLSWRITVWSWQRLTASAKHRSCVRPSVCLSVCLSPRACTQSGSPGANTDAASVRIGAVARVPTDMLVYSSVPSPLRLRWDAYFMCTPIPDHKSLLMYVWKCLVVSRLSGQLRYANASFWANLVLYITHCAGYSLPLLRLNLNHVARTFS